jgi:serine/threonine-protein kinase
MKERSGKEDELAPTRVPERSGATAFAPTTPMSSELARSLVREAGREGEAETVVAPASLRAPSRGPEPLGQRYQAGDVIGAGGMGEVRLMKDQWIGRDVALKTLHGDVAARADARNRFLREIRVQGQLEHPSIVPVYDLGESAAGELYFTMRRVRGVTLASVLDGLSKGDADLEKRFSRRKLLTAFSQICMVVHYAHSRGVIHRDLKPGNVMLGDFGEVYVLDWGIAKIVGVEDGDGLMEDHDSTGSGKVIGTLGYMPPEQATGDELDARTDVYALGVILFEILALEALLSETRPMQALKLITQGVDARPSLRARGADVPPELEALCVRATAREKADRFESAKALSDAVERYLDGDRDLERRRELASGYAETATDLVERATREGADVAVAQRDRNDAFRTVLKALALDPDHASAQRTLAKLLLEPPREMPPAARAEREAMQLDERAEGAGLGFRAFVSFLLAFPLMFVAGVKSWPLVGGGGAVIVVAAIVSRWMHRERQVGTGPFALLLALSAVLVVIQGTWLGPFVLMPMAATVTTSVFALYCERRHRIYTLAAGAAMILLPFLAELVPGIPKGYSFTSAGVVLHARALELPSTLTTIGLLYTNVGYVLLPGLFLTRLKDTLSVAEDRIFLQAWTMKQLFPSASIEGA